MTDTDSIMQESFVEPTIVGSNETEVFPLLDLPFEIVEAIISELNSQTLGTLITCSHQFKEIASSGHYWQHLIQKEKKKIIGVGADLTGIIFLHIYPILNYFMQLSPIWRISALTFL
jgi:hypothetical protein